MLAFFLSLLTTVMAPTGLAVAPATVTAPAAGVTAQPPFAWLGGTWRSGGLEMVCAARSGEMACREEGKSGPMQGAAADLTFKAQGAGAQAQLTVALPTVPASTFREIARDAQSSTFEMKTPGGVARLRFTRTGETLKIERGNAETWGTTMTYARQG